MDINALFAACRERKIKIYLENDRLKLSSSTEPPDEIMAAVTAHKVALKFMLKNPAWKEAPHWRERFNERAGIAEFDGGHSRANAEQLALEDCITEWLARHPVISPPDTCVHCKRSDRKGDILPYGVKSEGRAWLHQKCWPDWRSARDIEALKALALHGIAPAQAILEKLEQANAA
jgi:hypothetical protein